ncbi:hypothetical protein ABZ915_17855 [Streptomyces sp. NPDC046915]|uniref:hypothetical protein n=1 Tax=Streptomyces sp. NPDC046915 TaxID=3155257 RepID=UPI0033D9C5A4
MLGRRGAILLSYGTVWSLIGYAQLVTPQPQQPGLQLALDLLPLRAWGWLWMAAGLIAIGSAFAPQGLDWPGFLALPLIVLPWWLSYLTAWLQGTFPRGWVAAAVWAGIAVPVLVVAGWREPPRVKRLSASDGR